MALACSILAGILCVQAPVGGTTSLSIEDGGVWLSQTAAFTSRSTPAKTWKVTTGFSTEWAPPRIDTAKLAKTCIDGACQAYWRSCNDALHPTKCSFAIDAGSGAARNFTVEAPDETTLRDGLANAGVLSGPTRTPIAFAAMEKEAPYADPPFLKATGPQPF